MTCLNLNLNLNFNFSSRWLARGSPSASPSHPFEPSTAIFFNHLLSETDHKKCLKKSKDENCLAEQLKFWRVLESIFWWGGWKRRFACRVSPLFMWITSERHPCNVWCSGTILQLSSFLPSLNHESMTTLNHHLHHHLRVNPSLNKTKSASTTLDHDHPNQSSSQWSVPESTPSPWWSNHWSPCNAPSRPARSPMSIGGLDTILLTFQKKSVFFMKIIPKIIVGTFTTQGFLGYFVPPLAFRNLSKWKYNL